MPRPVPAAAGIWKADAKPCLQGAGVLIAGARV